jgi:hypothetical protein
MSFNSYKKPKLVETKLSKYYINKLLEQKNIIQDQSINKDVELVIPNDDSLYKKITNYLYKCICYMCANARQTIINNYGFIFIISLLIILLYVRYLEVDRRKIIMQKIIDKINDEESSDSSDSSDL